MIMLMVLVLISQRIVRVATMLVIAVLVMNSANAFAQSASLFQQPVPPVPAGVGPTPAAGLTLPNTSFYYQEPAPPQEIKLHDIVTVIVDEKSQVISEGELERRKNTFYDAALKDWIQLDGFDILPAPQENGDPRINGQLNSQYRTEAELETRDAMKFRISAEVVDVRPNGNLVLEARRQIRNNEETWEYSLRGIVRRDDVLPNNTVFSEKLAELEIHKRERGSIFDGYRRGWLLQLHDRLMPF